MNLNISEMEKLLATAKQSWIQQYNDGKRELEQWYLERGGAFLKDRFVLGRHTIVQELFDVSFPNIQTANPLAFLEHDATRFLEIGTYETVQKPLKYVIAWKLVNDAWLREFEAIEQHTGSPAATGGIEKTRREWVELANQHTPELHVESTYTANAWYLNCEQSSQGHAAITARYGYMADSNFAIDLKPHVSTDVRIDMVFEIGEWYMNEFSGAYVVIWQQTGPDDTWKIAVDFNF